MKSKLITSFLIALIALVSLTLVSALTLSGETSVSLSASELSKSITLGGNDLFNITSLPSSVLVNGNTVTIRNTTSTLNTTSSAILFSIASFPTITFGTTYSSTITVGAMNATNSSEVASKNITVSLSNNNFCGSVLNSGNTLTVDNIEFNVKDGFGSDEDYWYPFDSVEVSFTVDSGDYDVDNIKVKACLWDVDAKECVLKEKDMDISDNEFDLSSDSQDVTLSFDVDADKLNSGNNKYVMYISAQGKVNDNSVYDGNTTCSSDSRSIDVRTTDNFVILNNFQTEESYSCDAPLDITADLWNIGNDNIDNKDLYVEVYNKELNIDKVINFDKDLDSFEKTTISVSSIIPTNVTAKTYNLRFSVYDDKSLSSNHIYQNSEDDKAIFDLPVTVTACTSVSKASITAELSSETPRAIIGSEVIVESTIKNTGSSTATYTVSVEGNNAWSTLAQIDPQTITLNAGESKKVSIYLNVNEDAAIGMKEFTIKTTQGTSVTSQKVQLELENGFSFSNLKNHFKTNWIIYVIVLINLVLIIAIILVVRSILRRSR